MDKEDHSSRRKINELCQELSDAPECAMATTNRLSKQNALLRETVKRKVVIDEMDKLESEFSEAVAKAQKYFKSRGAELASLATDASENTRQR